MTATSAAPKPATRPTRRRKPAAAPDDAAVAAEQALDHRMHIFRNDPLGFVRWAFPWGQAGTPLARQVGPERWQAEVLEAIGQRLRQGLQQGVRQGARGRDGNKNNETVTQPIQIAVSSGHGVGKSALVSWLVLWAISTAEETRGTVTANTETQLRTKTWSELSKWHRLARTRHRFSQMSNSIRARVPGMADNWRIDMVPWSLTQTEAFAGLHNLEKRLLLVFDEASAIPEKIWEVTEGSLIDRGTEIIWVVFGNPTQTTGRFFECFHGLRHRWQSWTVDSRSTRLTNQAQIARWITDYGPESDFVKVRVKGQFPSTSARQFIPARLVDQACARLADVVPDPEAPRVMGVDVARFGDDASVILIRQGNRLLGEIERHHGLDLMQFAAIVNDRIEQWKPNATFVDGAGIGGGVVDRLRQLGRRVHDVNAGAAPRKRRDYANRRAEMWDQMRKWLRTGALPDDADLINDLKGPEYSFDATGHILLEKKEKMKARGLASPDAADALALTFADPVPANRAERRRFMARTDFSVL
ncbi:MAG: hypothetical protein P1U65_04685 [Minwuia sp.]|nr:hypothetical protein [Minwuia sp.]